MKKYLLIGLMFFMGCASVPCPKENIVMPMFNPLTGNITNFMLEKGDCDDPANYITLEEFERQIKEKQKERRMH